MQYFYQNMSNLMQKPAEQYGCMIDLPMRIMPVGNGLKKVA